MYYSMLSNTDILKYNLFDLKGLGDTFKNIACSDMIFFTLKKNYSSIHAVYAL